jgi:glycosyl transferase family 2
MTSMTVITPTRDRPEAFSLCCRWMGRQGFKESLQWIVVDDGNIPVPRGPFEHLRRRPSERKNTLPDNLIAALSRAKGERILIIEDDDYYAPGYLTMMSSRLKREWASGEIRARYYNVQSRRWNIGKGAPFASLCRTGFRKEAIKFVLKAAEETKAAGDVSVDKRFWSEIMNKGVSFSLFERPKLTVSIKGLPGRGGLGGNHAPEIFPNKDPEGSVLKGWVGSGPFSEYSKILL